MTSYYPSQAGYSTTQPVMYGQPSYQGTAYAPSAGVMYVSPSNYSPTPYVGDGLHAHHKHHGGRRHRPVSRSYPYTRHRSKSRSSLGHSYRHSTAYERPSTPYYSVLEQSPYRSSYYRGVPVAQAAPVMMQPSMAGYQPGFDPRQLTFGQRMRLFFGLAPTPAFKYRSDKNWWGFMGYSRRQRFIDPRTGGEVDRNGRPVIRV